MRKTRSVIGLMLCGGLAISGGGMMRAQGAPMTAAPAVNVSGRWLGAFDIVQSGGSVQEDKGIFELKQEGSAITGSAGPEEDKMGPVSEGTVQGHDVRFAVAVHQGVTVRFALKLEGDRLRGEATGLPDTGAGSTIVVNMARWPEGAAAPELVHVKDGLFATVSALDTKLFDAYNHCDLTTLGAMVTDDLEFYHDKTGLAVGKQKFVDAIKNNICPGHVQRELVPGSLEVYPLNGYGAVEVGVHRFRHPGEPGNVGEAKFLTVWQNKDGAWKISRAISYDHEPLKQ